MLICIGNECNFGYLLVLDQVSNDKSTLVLMFYSLVFLFKN